jgi:hypothetical protein
MDGTITSTGDAPDDELKEKLDAMEAERAMRAAAMRSTGPGIMPDTHGFFKAEFEIRRAALDAAVMAYEGSNATPDEYMNVADAFEDYLRGKRPKPDMSEPNYAAPTIAA